MEVGGYVRVSSRRQRDESDSPASQRQRLKDAGCTVFYEDLAVSGYRLPQRRKAVEFQRMWHAIASGQLNRLVATRLDRYARRDQIVLELAEHCDQHGVEFVSLSSGVVDTTSASGWLNVKVQLMFAEHYSRQLSENIKQGFAGLHSQGIPACSGMSIPWHLQRDPSNRHGVIEGPGWADARFAFEQLLGDQWSLSDAADFLYPRHGVMRSHTSVREWLRRPSLVGHLVRNASKADRMVMRDCWPALATELEQLQVLQVVGQHTRARKSKGGGRQVRALSGLCVCAECGGNLRIHGAHRAGQPRGQYLRCGSQRSVCQQPMVPVAVVETQLLTLLGPRLKQMV
jgi:DNA invertase Pin-like site-specific DNA recombinase